MGIPGLWDLVSDCKEIISLTEFATQHFEQHKRPLRIAVEEATWRHRFYINGGNIGKVDKKYSNLYLNERNFITVVLRLLKLNIQLVFVADGPHKPIEKHGGKGAGIWTYKNDILHKCLKFLGVKWHNAPGEAEAECARLQRRGTVDCVWTDDGDALMFGCGMLIRFLRGDEEDGERKNGKGGKAWKTKNGGMKDLDRVMLYRANVIQSKHPGFDREGLVLFVVLSGGDYGKGLRDCGPGKARKIVEMGFGKELCEVMKSSGDLSAWRKNLRKFLMDSRLGVSIPESFPTKRIVGLYNEPCISSTEGLKKLEENVWKGEIDERELQSFFIDKFNWGIDKYIDLVLPIILTRSLASVKNDGKSSIDEYHLTYLEDGLRCTVWYTLFAVTSLGKELVDICIENLNKRRSERNWKSYQLPWGEEPWVEGRGLLTCIVKHVMGQETFLEPEVETEQSILKGSRRSFSPQLTILGDRTRVKKSRVSVSPPPMPQNRFAITKGEIAFDTTMYQETDDESIKKILKPPRQSRSPSPPIILDKREIMQGHDASAEIAIESLGLSMKAGNRLRPAKFTDSILRSTKSPHTNTPSNIKFNAPPSPPSISTKEEYTSTYVVAMDEPLDLDSESESLDAAFSTSKVSKPLLVAPLPLNSLFPQIASDSYYDSHLNTTTTNKLESKFEFGNEAFTIIAMDEPLDLDSETESVDARLSVSSMSKPPLQHGPSASHFQSSFPSDLDISFISKIPPRVNDQLIDKKEGNRDRNTHDETFYVAMDEELELDEESSLPHKSISVSSRALRNITRPNAHQLANSLAPHHVDMDTVSKLEDKSNLDSSIQNLRLKPKPNVILYPAHPTGPYQELDVSELFSSQPVLSSQSPSQSRDESQANPHQTKNDTSHTISAFLQQQQQLCQNQEIEIDMMNLSGFFSSGSSLHESPPLSQN
ncbi:hypothetical protein EYC80_001608 [Monilinia laxa]|uniref:XPG-I domain-containing protein n=1 Tax=Monilinia laxa TaxID=61186 RepID=A0A5N6K5K2_MONLA|nr:hypothetical protein EYC80_001608 [Monilinia laxa]